MDQHSLTFTFVIKMHADFVHVFVTHRFTWLLSITTWSVTLRAKLFVAEGSVGCCGKKVKIKEWKKKVKKWLFFSSHDIRMTCSKLLCPSKNISWNIWNDGSLKAADMEDTQNWFFFALVSCRLDCKAGGSKEKPQEFCSGKMHDSSEMQQHLGSTYSNYKVV